MQWEKLINPSRFLEGVPKSEQVQKSRSIFEQDYDRIIFSYPFRCLQDKTQVFPLPKTDFVHTRLTHSLEVSSVGRSLGRKAGKVIVDRHPALLSKGISQFEIGAIVAAAALAHDIGNPPFGHSGEDAISAFFTESPLGQKIKKTVASEKWADLINYEGNAQGFRLLTNNNFQGLRVTYATLATFSKYPRESKIDKVDPNRKSQKKYGFFQAEKDVFIETANKTGLTRLDEANLVWSRHPLAFLVEAADDICYSIIDLEDGCNLGLVSIETVKDLLAPILGNRFNPEKFNRIPLMREKVSLLRALVISELIEQVSKVFIDLETDILNGTFDKALTSVIPGEKYLKEIIRISVKKIYQSTPVLEKEAAGFEVLSGLLDAFAGACFDFYTNMGRTGKKNATIINLFPLDLRQSLETNSDDLYKIMLSCLDYIILMTDTQALETYRKIKGISIPGF